MSNNDLTIRFTEEKYATRRDVMRALNTSLIDSIWRNIEEYRSRFSRLLSLRDVTQKAMYITYSSNIIEKITNLERKLTRAMSLYNNFEKGSKEHLLLQKENEEKILTSLAKFYQLTINQSDLNLILSNKNFDSKFNPLVNYYKTLKYISSSYHPQIDESFLAEVYAKLEGVEELVSFYRTKPYSEIKRIVIGQQFEFAPDGLIETLMGDLIDFINKSEISFVVKLAATYYFLDYVKPFASLNKEIALIMMKNILVISDLSEISAILPFEVLLTKHDDKLKEVFSEVQKTNDLTYALLAISEILLHEVENFLDLITNVKIIEAKKEFHSLDEEVEIKKEVEVEKVVVDSTLKEVIITKGEEVVIKVEEKEKPEDLKLIVKSLLVSNPLLRPKQAQFYAKHRTIGKYYTIAMYQKEMNVVYETARTSMEQLVTLGYYRRESVKNKFVYTPVKK